MPGRPRCPERSPSYLGLGRAGKLMWGSGPLGALGNRLYGTVVLRAEASGFRGAQASKRITESGKVGGRAWCPGPLGSRVLAALGCSFRASIRVPLWSLERIQGGIGVRARRNYPFDRSSRPSPQNQSCFGMHFLRLPDGILEEWVFR